MCKPSRPNGFAPSICFSEKTPPSASQQALSCKLAFCRDEEHIRAGLYLKLGLLKETPVNITFERSSKQPHHTSCFHKKTWSAIHATEVKSVTFFERVQVRTIPSHRDLDEETRNSLYGNPDHFEQELRRNKYEFWVDGGNWRHATEEEDFYEAEDGSLVHPASWSLMANLACQYRRTFHTSCGAECDDCVLYGLSNDLPLSCPSDDSLERQPRRRNVPPNRRRSWNKSTTTVCVSPLQA